jgi:hypothetical protein
MAILVIGLATGLVTGVPKAHAAERVTQNGKLMLSPDLADLLRAEMREISSGVQIATLSLATGDWRSIEDTSAQIRASYIMEKKLTPAQVDELEKSLPEDFKHLDAEFHDRAKKLGAAAAEHDSELVTFHFARLLESCTRCHSSYASNRFPGFVSPTPQGHQH